jgi:hypothetical protein
MSCNILRQGTRSLSRDILCSDRVQHSSCRRRHNLLLRTRPTPPISNSDLDHDSDAANTRRPHHLPRAHLLPSESLPSPCSLDSDQRRCSNLEAASATAVTWRRRRQQREQVPLRRRARSRRRCRPTNAADTRRPHPPFPTPFPLPAPSAATAARWRPSPGGGTGNNGSRGRCGDGPGPPGSGDAAGPAAGGGCTWGQGNKNTVAYPIVEQDKSDQAAHRDEPE